MRIRLLLCFVLVVRLTAVTMAQSNDTVVRGVSIGKLNDFGFEAYYGQHLFTTLLNDSYPYSYSSPIYMLGRSMVLHLQPFPKWRFGLVYSRNINKSEVDLGDLPPYDTLLNMYQTMIALDVEYLLMQRYEKHYLWLGMRSGYILTGSDGYMHADSMPGQYGFPDWLDGFRVDQGAGKGAHLQFNIHYVRQFYGFLSLGVKAGIAGNYIHHEMISFGSLSTPWWPGISYADEEIFDAIQYFGYASIDLTMNFSYFNNSD